MAALQPSCGLAMFQRRLLGLFPRDFELVFSYGSGVFPQRGHDQRTRQANMVDVVLAVDDPVTWHTINLLQNRGHYSSLKLLGPQGISRVQDRWGARIYYNTLVPLEDKLIKYGVISTEALLDDLLHWRTLYVAGRLHKPVKILAQGESPKLRSALAANLRSALTAALLMLPESFGEDELFLTIAGLSYAGDFRMLIGEDRSKVANIVSANTASFRTLYGDILRECPQVVYKPHHGSLEVDKSPEGHFLQLMSLPVTLQQNIRRWVDPPGKNRDVEEVLLQVAQDPDCASLVQQGISSIVKVSSITQSLKGVATAGLWKSLRYSSRKLAKMWRGWRRDPPGNRLPPGL